MSVTGQLRGSLHYIWSPNEVVGRGATGEVYKCRSKNNGDIFAVKTFNNYAYMRPPDVQQRELEVMRKLEHPNVVKTMAIEEEQNTGRQVIVMEYCNGGSLYELLEEPRYYFGVPEDDFLIILRHVADGMEYLNQKNVVHRDIKPGNILRVITEEKRHIYKLSDFGAARELHDEEENFMSMHGTEEYLHPNVYERAVMRQGHGRHFDSTVDLWSLGATLYHIATGQLPFRPFGGRRNKETMFQMTSKKIPGVISGLQETENGEIIWGSELPNTCVLSQGLRNLITPLIAGLLERDPGIKWTFLNFFEESRIITEKVSIYVFHVCYCVSLRIYADKTDSLAKFQELIAEQTEIPASNQYLLHNYRELSDVVHGTQSMETYPKTAQDNPVILLFLNEITDVKSRLEAIEIPKFPRFGTAFSLDNDAPLSKQCTALMCLVQRNIVQYNLLQMLLQLAVSQYMSQVIITVNSMKGCLDQIQSRLDQTHSLHSYFMRSNKIERRLLGLLFKGKVKTPQEIINFCQKCDTYLLNLEASIKELFNTSKDILRYGEEYHVKVVRNNELIKKWDPMIGCSEEDRCTYKIQHLVECVDKIREDFKRDKKLGRLTYNEEQIHKVDKNNMNTHCSVGVTLSQDHCFPNLRRAFKKFMEWYNLAHKVKVRVGLLEKRVVSLLDKQLGVAMTINERQESYGQKVEELVQQIEMGRLQIKPGQLTVEETHTPSSGKIETSHTLGAAAPSSGTAAGGEPGEMDSTTRELFARLTAETEKLSSETKGLMSDIDSQHRSLKELEKLQLNGCLDESVESDEEHDDFVLK